MLQQFEKQLATKADKADLKNAVELRGRALGEFAKSAKGADKERADRVYALLGSDIASPENEEYNKKDLERELAEHAQGYFSNANGLSGIKLQVIDPVSKDFNWEESITDDTLDRVQSTANAGLAGAAIGAGASLAAVGAISAAKRFGRVKLGKDPAKVASGRRKLLKYFGLGAGITAITTGSAGTGAAVHYFTGSDRADAPGAITRETLYRPGQISGWRERARLMAAGELEQSPQHFWRFVNPWTALTINSEAYKLKDELGRKPRIVIVASSVHAGLPEDLADPQRALREFKIAVEQGDAGKFNHASLESKFELTAGADNQWTAKASTHPSTRLLDNPRK
jgi:hypothetical protein